MQGNSVRRRDRIVGALIGFATALMNLRMVGCLTAKMIKTDKMEQKESNIQATALSQNWNLEASNRYCTSANSSAVFCEPKCGVRVGQRRSCGAGWEEGQM